MNGLILAAGDGSRLLADGVPQPKTLVEVAGRPQLLHLIDTLRHLGCKTVTCMVPGAQAQTLFERVPVESRPGVEVVGCRTPSSLHTLVLGFSMMPPGSVLCTMVDTVMRAPDWSILVGRMRMRLSGKADLVLAVTPYVDDERPLYVVQDGAGRVRDLSDQPVEPVAVTGGVYAFNDVARAAAWGAAERGTERLRHFLRDAVRGTLHVSSVMIPRIIDVDRARDLAAANAWLSPASAT